MRLLNEVVGSRPRHSSINARGIAEHAAGQWSIDLDSSYDVSLAEHLELYRTNVESTKDLRISRSMGWSSDTQRQCGAL